MKNITKKDMIKDILECGTIEDGFKVMKVPASIYDENEKKIKNTLFDEIIKDSGHEFNKIERWEEEHEGYTFEFTTETLRHVLSFGDMMPGIGVKVKGNPVSLKINNEQFPNVIYKKSFFSSDLFNCEKANDKEKEQANKIVKKYKKQLCDIELSIYNKKISYKGVVLDGIHGNIKIDRRSEAKETILNQRKTMNFKRIEKVKQDGTLEGKKDLYFKALSQNGVPKDKLTNHKTQVERILSLDSIEGEDIKTIRDFEFFLKLGLNILPNEED